MRDVVKIVQSYKSASKTQNDECYPFNNPDGTEGLREGRSCGIAQGLGSPGEGIRWKGFQGW